MDSSIDSNLTDMDEEKLNRIEFTTNILVEENKKNLFETEINDIKLAIMLIQDEIDDIRHTQRNLITSLTKLNNDINSIKNKITR